jgi:hypothetical protein
MHELENRWGMHWPRIRARQHSPGGAPCMSRAGGREALGLGEVGSQGGTGEAWAPKPESLLG